MTRKFLAVTAAAVFLCSCGNNSNTPAQATSTQTPAGGPHASVVLKDGGSLPGTIVASTAGDITVEGDDGIERTIPMDKVQSVNYGTAPAPAASPNAAAPPPPPMVTTKTFELPVGNQVSVRTNVLIDSGTAADGQIFDAQVTRNARDASGDVVIPKGSVARLVIRSASKGGHFRGASDLVLDLQSVTIAGTPYVIHAGDIAEKGRAGVGANKRTGEFAGGGAALGAIIGAIAGGGKGAAIGGGSGAGAGVAAELLTKGGSIKIPAETVLTFQLDRPLDVSVSQ